MAEVQRILRLHNKRLLHDESDEIEHDISDISHRISKYSEDLDQISIALRSAIKGSSVAVAKSHMQLKVKSAIEQAHSFEKTLKHLIKEGKFLEKKIN